MKRNLIGLDIGGTKCAVVYGQEEEGELAIVDKIRFATTAVDETITNILSSIDELLARHQLTPENTDAIGISCGGPLDSKLGLILSPPNLKGWDHIEIVRILRDRFHIPAFIQNDANACALAEWKYGAGKGSRNMVFLTFGTGLGAGIIIDGHLYSGANDNAGELGHIRLNNFGPVGYGKVGSFEGFCSGNGIAQLARSMVFAEMQMGRTVEWCKDVKLDDISAKMVFEAADAGDKLARKVVQISSEFMGRGLSMIIDILNPEVIVLGGIFMRSEGSIRPYLEKVIAEEALPLASAVCVIRPAALGESVGDIAALSVATQG